MLAPVRHRPYAISDPGVANGWQFHTPKMFTGQDRLAGGLIDQGWLEQFAVGRRQWAAASGQCAVDSGHWALGSGR